MSKDDWLNWLEDDFAKANWWIQLEEDMAKAHLEDCAPHTQPFDVLSFHSHL